MKYQDLLQMSINERLDPELFDADQISVRLVDGLISRYKYHDPQLEGPMHLFVNYMNQLDAPWLSTPGNHDYYSVLEPFTLTSDKEAREAAYTAVYGTPPYYAHMVNGVKLIALNSLDGPLWNANGGLAGAFSEQQLDWLDNELADEVPALLFLHHPPATVLTTEDGRSLCDVLLEHPGIARAFFAGHLHSFQKGEYCSIPYFAVTSVKPGQEFYFLVEYDGANDILTLVNEAHIPFVEPPDFDCEEGKNPIESFESAVATFQQLKPFNLTGDLPDIGSYAAEIFESVPFVLHFDAWDQDQSRYETRITLASRWGDNGDYLEYMDGAPCLPLDLDVTEPCFTAGPVSLAIDVTAMLGIVPDVGEFNPDWDLKLPIQNFWLEGRLAEVEGVPVIEAGVLHARLLGTKALNDLKELLVDEYCHEAIADCTPGTEDMPECPVENPGVKFFTSVPDGCDLEIAGYSLRMIIMMAEGLGLTDMDVLGEIESWVLETSIEAAGGFVDPTLFDETPDMNCGD